MSTLECLCDCECRTAMYCSAHRQLCDPGACAVLGNHECEVELVSKKEEQHV